MKILLVLVLFFTLFDGKKTKNKRKLENFLKFQQWYPDFFEISYEIEVAETTEQLYLIWDRIKEHNQTHTVQSFNDRLREKYFNKEQILIARQWK